MAHQSEPMDVDCMNSDFDNKENTFYHNVPCTEKGYEELDVSELNMKLRYSMTPASSPMSKSYTACPDSRYVETGDTLNCNSINANLTCSLNSSITKNDNVIKSLKSLPLQSLGTEQFADGNVSILRQQGSDNENVTVTVSRANYIDESLSLPSSSSSALHTPEATTPTKEIKDEGSPIIRGLKSVLNMFRSSTSPVPPMEGDNVTVKQEAFSTNVTINENSTSHAVASTPIAAHRAKDGNTSKRSSPYKESIVFNDDLEKELNWKNEQSVSSPEKMPVPKLLLHNSKIPFESKTAKANLNRSNTENNYYSVEEYMDISNNESIIQDQTLTESHPANHEVSITVESDVEFLDCETTFSRNESYVLDIIGVQEEMTGKTNLDETTSKYIEFEDCDSTISKNESYVLDIKEIHEKISAKVDLAQTKDISFTTESISTVKQTIDENATSMSFADLDFKFDATVPPDYFDYSQATAEILTELNKLEASRIDEKDQNIIHEDITSQQKDVTGLQVDTPEFGNVTQDNNDIEQNNVATESQGNLLNNTENKCNVLDTTLTEKQNAGTIQSNEPKIDNDSDSRIVPYTEPPVESENKRFQSHVYSNDNSNDGCAAKIENSFNIINADQILQTAIIQNCTSQNNVSGTYIISKENTETSIAISNNNAETALFMSNVIQNIVVPVEAVNSSLNDVVPSEALIVTTNNVNEESLEIPPADLHFPEDSVVELLLSTLDVNAIQATESQITENPCDIPLPADDVDEIPVIVGVLNTSVETAPISTSEKIITSSESKFNDNVHVIVDALVENKSSNDTILIPRTSEAQLSELKISENIDSKQSVVKTLKTLSENQIKNNEVVLPELNNLSLKNDSYLLLTQTDLTNFDLTLDAIESDKKTSDNLTVNKVDHNIEYEVVPSNNIIFNKDNIVADTTEIKENFHNSSHNFTENAVIDNLAHNQNTSEIEPMDFAINESLNLTYELPDLVNQTIILADDNVPNLVTSNDTVSSHIELAPNPYDAIKDNNLLTGNISGIIKCTSDFEANTIMVETVSANESMIKISEQKVVTNLSINKDKRSACETEIIKGDNENISSQLSDDQPPKVFTNTPDPEPMEIVEITMNEEIIVSANNSPYVSLMSDVNSVLEKYVEKTEIIEELKSTEEPENIEEPKRIEEPEKTEEPKNIEDAFVEIQNSFVTNSNVASSPPITSKGYNFNFDEIDDPFVTKTKIRESPPVATPTKPIEADNEKDKSQFKMPNKGVSNRRKSPAPEGKKRTTNKKCDSSFVAKSTTKMSTNKMDSTIIIDVQDKANTNETTQHKQGLRMPTSEIAESLDKKEENLHEINDKKGLKKDDVHKEIKIEKTSENPLKPSAENKFPIGSGDAFIHDLKTTSFSEQSTYYSAGASSTESFHSKNVFNLPEIDDANFNPFATKSKMRQSPIPDIEIGNPFATSSNMRQTVDPFAPKSEIRNPPEVSIISHCKSETNRTISSDESNLDQLAKNIVDEDKMETEVMDKDTSANIADTSSSNATDDQNLTTYEVNTEDEDTIEGPFLDAGEDIEKNTDFVGDNDDMLMFNDLQESARANDDNLDGELFIDAEAFEFLLNQNKSNVVADSGKESLFLKFDPLFAKRISTGGVLASLNKAQKRQSTPMKPTRPSLRNEASSIAGSSSTPTKPTRPSLRNEMSPHPHPPSTLNITYEGDNNISQESYDDANITVTKPMMVVTPAFNPAVSPRNKSITLARSNRRSITFTSPAIAVIDRLLSMSANNSILGHDSTITSSQSNGEQSEADQALTQLRELLAEKEISVYNLRSESKELKDRLSAMESQVNILETDGQERLKKINELHERLTEKTKINKSMAAVVEEYEKTIASLIADIEQDKKRNAEERNRLRNERDEQTAHLTSMEVSFSDLHSKYEKSKQVILTCKSNEEIYKKSIQDFEEQVTKMQTNYEMLKQHATAKLNHANQELEKMNRAHEAEVVKLNAMIKRNHLLATSLQETLAQKTKANDELTAICDELINKVGSNK